MRSIVVTFVWEFWVLGRRWFALIILAMFGLLAFHRYHLVPTLDPSFQFGAAKNAEPLSVFLGVFPASLFVIVWAMSFALSERKLGFPRRLFTAPASTFAMVSCKMAIGVCAAALLYVISIVLAGQLYGFAFPCWGPAYFCATITSCVLAGFWSLKDFRVTKLVAWWLFVASLVFWLVHWFHPNGLDADARIWSSTTPVEWCVMTVYLVAAWGLAIVDVGRDRCGSFRDWPDLQILYERLTDPFSRRGGDFHSPSAAQFWCEWRPKGLVVPGLFTCLCLLIFGLALGNDVSAGNVDEFAGALIVVLPCTAGLIIGLFFGHRNDQFQLDGLSATRPLSDVAISTTILRAATFSTFLTWVAGLLTMAVLCGWIAVARRQTPCISGPTGEWLDVALLLFFSLLTACTICRLVATLLLTGRNWLCATVIIFLGSCPIVTVLLSYMGWMTPVRVYLHTLGFSFGIGVLAGTVLLFVLAHRRRAISLTVVVGSCAAWLGLCAIFGHQLGWYPQNLQQMMVAAVLLGLFALPFTPSAAAPLAVTWNRHR